jgi:hypothetical protein
MGGIDILVYTLRLQTYTAMALHALGHLDGFNISCVAKAKSVRKECQKYFKRSMKI